MTVPSLALRDRWLEALLPHVPFDGWTETAARMAADEAGLTDGERALAAPGGVQDLVERFFDRAAETARGALSEVPMNEMRVRDKVAAGVHAWLAALEPNREAVRRAVGRGVMPVAAGAAAHRTWSVADMIWTAAGDTATDHNHYTKRMLLSSALVPITLGWLEGPDESRLAALINRHIERAMWVGQTGGRVLGPVLSRLPIRAPEL